MDDTRTIEHDDNVYTKRGIDYTRTTVEEFKKTPEIMILYYDFLKTVQKKNGIKAMQLEDYCNLLSENIYSLIVATKHIEEVKNNKAADDDLDNEDKEKKKEVEFVGVAYCTFDKFSNYIFIRQFVTAPGITLEDKSMYNAVSYFGIKDKARVMPLLISDQKGHILTEV